MPVSDEIILKIMNSDLIHHELVKQYNIHESISENNVTHIFPISKKVQGGKLNVISRI